jgi:Predicted nucleoside-diphosphate sugar epimerases
VMVTAEDSATTYEYEKHYIIYPHYNWWRKRNIIPGGKKVNDGFEYNSGMNQEWLTVKQLQKLLMGMNLE